LTKQRNLGDFSGLHQDYAKNRPDYSLSVLKAILGLHVKPVSNIDFADIGAGTGIWTRMVHSFGPKSCKAVEPNSDMKSKGIENSENLDIHWSEGTAEKTGLDSESIDWLTMASSFHWANFEVALSEFHRVLRSDGLFTALWNPRFIRDNPILVEIEEFLKHLKPDLSRISSGRSTFTSELSENLRKSKYFEDIIYIEGRHTISMSQQRYLGAWKSVNDLQAQLGDSLFIKFLDFVENKISTENTIQATYETVSWSARKRQVN
jgi:ubiquinone/menaquinone biosynthesis C-methylase UbiE